jgi:hypothetical protein
LRFEHRGYLSSRPARREVPVYIGISLVGLILLVVLLIVLL